MRFTAEFTATGINAQAVVQNAMGIAQVVTGLDTMPEGWTLVQIGNLEPHESNDLMGDGHVHTMVVSWRGTFRSTWESPEVND